MNDARRKQIKAIIEVLETQKAEAETTRDEEQEYFDNMPENMQGGDKGSAAEEAISNLDSAIDNFANVIGDLQAAMEG